MKKPIDTQRLKTVRDLRGLTLEDLADASKLSKETIHRLEKGKQGRFGVRPTTIDRLAKALQVEPGVLTAELPIPTRDSTAAEGQSTPLLEKFPMNFRVDGAVRNAYSLAALRYQIPVARIVELAPLLFVLAA